ncbi:iron-sulfur cluster assembly scaffold protein [Geopsychrobacter electrodiphilus]|uniref:iron-sulfur cluster assembly scaffold protein n=1 Tax=Geopsychrobacter electrodiphilus TaxID=225196 RepID=UPI00037BE065|nr:iron-sulfur cluster assembly scaffold protein [Geopsychrobacter electrodiphilus]
MYSDKVMDHFLHPRNVGDLPQADAIGEIGNPADGDMLRLFLKIENKTITRIRFKTFGCAAAIATSSILTEMAIGKTLDEALLISKDDVATALDGLPADKMDCSNLAADALHQAIRAYLAERV